MILDDLRVTVSKVADDVCLSIDTCYEILSDILSAKVIPKSLISNKNKKVADAQTLLNEVKNDLELLNRVITGDENGIFDISS